VIFPDTREDIRLKNQDFSHFMPTEKKKPDFSASAFMLWAIQTHPPRYSLLQPPGVESLRLRQQQPGERPCFVDQVDTFGKFEFIVDTQGQMGG